MRACVRVMELRFNQSISNTYPQLLSSVGGAHSARLRESLRAGVRVWEGHVELCS